MNSTLKTDLPYVYYPRYILPEVRALQAGQSPFRRCHKQKYDAAGAGRTGVVGFYRDAYRLIFEEGHETLAAYEKTLTESMSTGEWQKWYEEFKQHVERSHREILKQVV